MSASHRGTEKEKPVYKIAILGDYACGKTSLIKVLGKKEMPAGYLTTPTPDIISIVIDSKQVKFCDIGGHERLGLTLPNHLKDKDAFVICYAADNSFSYSNVSTWRDEIRKINPVAPIMLLCLKFDAADERTKESIMQNLADKAVEIGAISHYAVNALKKINVKEPFEALINILPPPIAIPEITQEELESSIGRTPTISASDQLLRIYNAIYDGELTLFKKPRAWQDPTTVDLVSTLERMHAQDKTYSRTAEAKKLQVDFNKEFPSWDNPSSEKHAEHRAGVIIQCHHKAYKRSGLLKKTHDMTSLSLADILEKATRKPNSRTAKVVNALNGPKK